MKMLRNALVILFIALLSFSAMSAVDREEKVVYHIYDSTVARAALNNIKNHLNASLFVLFVVVTNGAGIDFLLDGAKDKNGNPYDVTVQELTNKKVEFRVCNNTLTTRQISKEKVIPEATIVPSGVAEVARLQIQEGYAYLKP